jgi:predicted DNA-binding transcriptional regulator YafY
MRASVPSGIDPAVHQLILAAIRNKRLLRFTYHGKARIVEPQDYGIQKNTVHLFTYQIGGESGSGPIPEWRKFAVPAISKLELLEQSFPGSRAVPEHRNQNWDVLFARVDHF